MRDITRLVIKHPLISGSFVIFIGSIGANVFNFLFNLFMSRNLSVEEYGILASLMSLVMLSAIPAGSIIPTVVKFAASSFAKNDLNYVRGLYFKLIKPMFIAATIFLLVFTIFATQIGEFFKIEGNSGLIILAGFTVFIIYLSVINGALLQAKLSFKFLSFISFLSAFLKFGLGAVLVLAGYKIAGAMGAFTLAFLAPFIIGFIPLRFLLNFKITRSKIDIKKIFLYGVPSALALFSVTSLISTDILLIKHFFSPSDAGLYAGLSLIGKVIFFFSAPIGTVMFPLIIQKHEKGENFHNSFKLAFGLVLFASVVIEVFYFLFPELIIKFFIKNEQYLEISNLLGLFGAFIAIYALLSLMMYFYLSIKKTKIYIPLVIGAFLQAILIWFFHDTFMQVILISIFVTGALLIIMVGYYIKLFGKKALIY